mmetsp:Transcript_7659/g.18907  ORF Transcript_7659/g.18907 Transcript_7659/m.18907 type:complete len:1047 (+) Transcript_7659:87-3227(+)
MNNNKDNRDNSTGGGGGGVRRRLLSTVPIAFRTSSGGSNGRLRSNSNSNSSMMKDENISEAGSSSGVGRYSNSNNYSSSGGGGGDSNSTSSSSRSISDNSPVAAAPPSSISHHQHRFSKLTKRGRKQNSNSNNANTRHHKKSHRHRYQQQPRRPYLYQDSFYHSTSENEATSNSNINTRRTSRPTFFWNGGDDDHHHNKKTGMKKDNPSHMDRNDQNNIACNCLPTYAYDGYENDVNPGATTGGAQHQLMDLIETGMNCISCQGGGDGIVDTLQRRHRRRRRSHLNDDGEGCDEEDDGRTGYPPLDNFLGNKPYSGGKTTTSRDPEKYARLHEDFFESLLKEQAEIAGFRLFSDDDDVDDDECSNDGNKDGSTAVGEGTDSPPLQESESRESRTTVSSDVSKGSSAVSVGSGAALSPSTNMIRGKNRQNKFSKIMKPSRAKSTSLRRRGGSNSNRVLRHSSSMPLAGDVSHESSRRHTYSSYTQPQRFATVGEIDELRLDEEETPENHYPPVPKMSPSSDPSIISLYDIVTKTHLPRPEKFVHQHCVLQKDKGRGDSPLGCSISATGRTASLAKLRDKMKLVMQVSKGGDVHQTTKGGGSGNSSTASCSSGGSNTATGNFPRSTTAAVSSMLLSAPRTGMKRRVAKVSRIAESTGYVETRSMIELQLGFLSMQYGLLIQWDARNTDKIVFICLRKMCHDSFYTRIPQLLEQSSHPPCAASPAAMRKGLSKRSSHRNSKPRGGHSQGKTGRRRSSPGPPLVVRCRRGNDAVYDNSLEQGATEVVLVDHPYYVPHPPSFDPSILTIEIHECTGLSMKSDWALSLTFDGHTEIAHLRYNPDRFLFETTRTTPCKWEMAMPHLMTSFDKASLDIRLFERRGGGLKQAQRRLTRRNSSSSINSRTSTNSLNSSGGSTNSRSNHNRSLHKNSRLASTVPVPLGGLISQPSATDTTLWKLTMPFDHDESGQLTLTLIHQSQYAQWLYQELKSRRKEEKAAAASEGSMMWSSALLGSYTSANDDEGSFVLDEDEDIPDHVLVLDCLCGLWQAGC